MTSNRLPYVCKWLRMTADQVLDKFMNLNNAFTDGEGDNRFVYVPGNRENRALIVAHADTVWGNTKINLDYFNGIVYSTNRFKDTTIRGRNNSTIKKYGIGIGADDRAGCAIAWRLRELGHSILITSGEEIGCIASKWLMTSKTWEQEINDTHAFAVQFDRKGHKDVVFYDVATNNFVKYVKEQTGYTPTQGFSTDIKHLCKKISGVNISVGYHDEHAPNERLVVDQWENTLAIAKEWLSKEVSKYKLDASDLFKLPVTHQNNNYNNLNYYDDYYNSYITGNNQNSHAPNDNYNKKYKQISCRNNNCNCQMTVNQWFENSFKCIKCNVPM